MRFGILVAAVLTLTACGNNEAGLPQGDPFAGAELVEIVSPSCSQCHTLESAGFTGESAPNLDAVRPGYQRVLDAVRHGPGFMPSYEGTLTDREMQDIAAFISNEVAR